jgi:hypothetical protein
MCARPGGGAGSSALFVWLISHQPAVLFSQNKPATSNQPAVLFSHNKSAPAISHQPNEQAAGCCTQAAAPWGLVALVADALSLPLPARKQDQPQCLRTVGWQAGRAPASRLPGSGSRGGEEGSAAGDRGGRVTTRLWAERSPITNVKAQARRSPTKTIYRNTHPSESIEEYSELKVRVHPFLRRAVARLLSGDTLCASSRPGGGSPVATGRYSGIQSFTFPWCGCGGGALHKIRQRSTSPASIRPTEHLPRHSRT